MTVLLELEAERHNIHALTARHRAFERKQNTRTAIEFTLLAIVWAVLGFAIAIMI